MSKFRAVINEAELKDGKLIISKINLIEAETGDFVREMDINQYTLDYFKRLEFDIDVFLKIEKMKNKNPHFIKLIDTFKLYT